MEKNILVLTGSPRVGGNSDLMAEAFIKGAKAAGHEVVKYEAGKKDIKGCKACDTCFSKGTACSFDDDFNSLALLLAKADAIVFATPIYWFTFPAQIKAAIDKLYSFIIGNKALNVKECMLLVCGEMEDEAVFSGIVSAYEQIAKYQQWTDRGHLIVPGVSAKGDIVSTSVLQKVEKMVNAFEY
jgi:multimeric flavodoxin WrbA